MGEKMEKPIYKKWWFWVVAIFVPLLIISAATPTDNQTSNITNQLYTNISNNIVDSNSTTKDNDVTNNINQNDTPIVNQQQENSSSNNQSSQTTNSLDSLKEDSNVSSTQIKEETSTPSPNTSHPSSETSTSSPDTSTQTNTDEQMVWVGDTGTKYHKQNCRTLKGNGHQITMQQAIAEGREACKVCY